MKRRERWHYQTGDGWRTCPTWVRCRQTAERFARERAAKVLPMPPVDHGYTAGMTIAAPDGWRHRFVFRVECAMVAAESTEVEECSQN